MIYIVKFSRCAAHLVKKSYKKKRKNCPDFTFTFPDVYRFRTVILLTESVYIFDVVGGIRRHPS